MVRGLVAIAMGLLLASCTADTLLLGLGPPPEPAAGDPARYACLSVMPEVLRFTSVEGALDDQKDFAISSRCPWSVMLSRLDLSTERGGFFVPDGAAPNVRIEPNGLLEVTVGFRGVFEAPKEQGVVQPVFDGDYVDAEHQVALEGVSIDSRVEIDVDEIDFGEVIYEPSAGRGSPSLCSSDLRYLHITNVGYQALNVGRVWTEIEDGPFSVEFVEAMGTIVEAGMPFSVERGERAQVALRYRPWGIEREEDTLLISHDSAALSSEVKLYGEGVPPTPVREAFTQGTTVVMDILWVIDSSGSMEEEHARLLANLSEFVSYADAVGADYQMGVIQAQALESGAGIFEVCDPHPPVVHSEYADRATRNEAFRCLVDVGTDGFATESALGAARLALLEARLGSEDPDVNPNAGFLRPNASLTVVAISDEDDQSLLPDDALIDALYAAKDHDRGAVKFHAIAGPIPSGCAHAEAAQRYASAAAETDGRFFSICSPNWSPVLRDLGLDVFRPRYQWTLRFPAEVASIRVSIDGRPVPRDPRNGYHYDADRRTIVFNGMFVPPAGSSVVIDYFATCSS